MACLVEGVGGMCFVVCADVAYVCVFRHPLMHTCIMCINTHANIRAYAMFTVPVMPTRGSLAKSNSDRDSGGWDLGMGPFPLGGWSGEIRWPE